MATAPTTLVNPNFSGQSTDGSYSGATPPPVAPSQATTAATPTTTPAPATPDSTVQPPSDNLATGSKGADVQQLQNWLVQQGYLTPDQLAGGEGTYGPKTTAAVAKLQQDLGVQAGKNAGDYGPMTQAALKSKYNNYFQSKQGVAPSDTNPRADIASYSQPSSDPVFGAMTSAMAPIMQSLQQVLSNINNPALTGVSLQQEYNDLATKSNLPGLQTQMMNMQNVMNGTTDDIRSEITKAGGTATESQVQAMSTARNNVILKQYNALSTQYQAASTNVQNMMQYASTDQQTALQKQQMTASVTESMGSIYTQMVGMAQTMQQHTTDNLNKIVTNVGYQGLAAQAKDNPQMLASYERSLGLSAGSLSNPTSLQQLETLRQQTVAQGAQKVQIQMYNAGLSNGSSPSGLPGNYITQPGKSASLVALHATGDDSQGRPYSVSASQAQNLLKSGASIDPGTSNITVPGIGYYVAQPDGSFSLSIDPASKEGQFIQYRNRAENPAPWEPRGSLSNQRMTRNALSRQVNTALKQYVDSPLYQNVSAGATYFAKLDAGLKNPGSVGDPDIIDSLVKINTGGYGAITEQQYASYAQGSTWADKFAVADGKVVAKGGTLSPSQRTQIKQLAQDTFSNYRGEYEQLYTQAMKNLDNQSIPDAFWGNMPEWTGLINGTGFTPLTEE